MKISNNILKEMRHQKEQSKLNSEYEKWTILIKRLNIYPKSIHK